MPKGIVQCSHLGFVGRFGNAVQQYVAVKSYAEKYDCIFNYNILWNGLKIFDVKEDVLKNMVNLRIVDEHSLKFGSINVDIQGFFQNDRYYRIISLSKSRQWLKIKNKWLKKFPKKKDFYIACHLRRGDMVKNSTSYPTFTVQSYINAVKKFGYNENDIVWVSEDNPVLNDECDSLDISFLPDFMTLYHSNILFRANSTFSFWAGVLGNCEMYSPIYDFPGYGSMSGLIDVDFVYGLGPDKEGVISQ